MTGPSTDRRFMRRALALALHGRGTTTPNPTVGAVVVRNGEVVGEGWTQPAGGAHAEIVALEAAGDAAAGATVYVTLEPCAGTGRTPPCVDALISHGVRRVVFAATDPNPAMTGGAHRLSAAGVEVLGGIEVRAARDQNPGFFHRFSGDRPFVTLKLARSLDGGIAAGGRAGGWLTGPAARRDVHRQRAEHDAVGVGVGTVISDDPALTVRGVEPAREAPPVRVVFDRTARIPLTSTLVLSAREVPVVVLACAATPERITALRHANVTVALAPDLRGHLEALRNLGVNSLYCEGGATLADALLGEGLVDRLVIFTTPVFLGADAVRPLQAGAPMLVEQAVRHRLVSHRRMGDDLMAIYDLTSRVHRTR